MSCEITKSLVFQIINNKENNVLFSNVFWSLKSNILPKCIMVNVLFSFTYSFSFSQKGWTSVARSAYLWTILKLNIVAIEEKTSRKILIRNFGRNLAKELLTVSSRRKSIYSEYRDIISKSEVNFRNEILLECHFISRVCSKVYNNKISILIWIFKFLRRVCGERLMRWKYPEWLRSLIEFQHD